MHRVHKEDTFEDCLGTLADKYLRILAMTITRKVVLGVSALVALVAATACADIACIWSVRRHLDERDRWHDAWHEILDMRKHEGGVVLGASSAGDGDNASREALLRGIATVKPIAEQSPEAVAAMGAYSDALKRVEEWRVAKQQKLDEVRNQGRRVQQMLIDAGLADTHILEARRQEKNIMLFGESGAAPGGVSHIERFAEAIEALRGQLADHSEILNSVGSYESTFEELLAHGSASDKMLADLTSAGDALVGAVRTAATLAGAAADRAQRFAVIITLLALALAFVGTLALGFEIFVWVARPVRGLLVGTRRVARGDLDHKVQLRSRDELGELARSFDEMTGQLKRSRDEVEQLRIAEKKELREELIQSERLAATGRLAAGIAHEINNPLCGIKAAIECIAKGLPSAADDKLARSALAEIDRIADLLRNMQKLHRPEDGRETLVDINSLLGDILLLTGATLRRSGVKIRAELDPATPKILGRDAQLRQVFANLIINAGEAMPEGGTLLLRTRPRFDSVIVEVRDTGRGIPPEDLERIFEPFFTRKKGRRGAGLGLAISYEIIGHHKGHIHVESEPGRGTTFTVVLPVRKGGSESGRQT